MLHVTQTEGFVDQHFSTRNQHAEYLTVQFRYIQQWFYLPSLLAHSPDNSHEGRREGGVYA